MHIIDALQSNFYEIDVSGSSGTMSDVFEDWKPHDRFGLLVYEPLAGTGAAHLIQLACMCFYDSKPARRTDRKIYPEIFAIHVGEWRGGHGEFDFWPARREVRVDNDPCEILGAINDRGITRLAMPERPQRDIVHRRKEEDCALDRLVTVVTYGPTGRVSNPDFTIRSNNGRSEQDVRRVIRPKEISKFGRVQQGKPRVPVKEWDTDYGPRQAELNANVTPALREQAERHREALKVDGLVTESYRFVSPEIALRSL
ncbi:hypothetical protein [Massilia orientalis]|uniref:Uncharacterized protein n=1 Tax=Massilia orientalis TaxID=3050128 RepID=A0ACC7MLV0_9BURK|nr:hypothetical protein [Massilia sp. YIM B02787]